MGKLQELIERYCPDGVEYKMLGEVATLIKGSGLQKKDFTDTGVGCIHYGQIHTRFGISTDSVVSYVPEELAKKLTVVDSGDIVVAVTSEDVSACCKAVAWMGDEAVVTGGHCVVVKTDMDPKFVSYCFATSDFYRQKKKLATGVKVVEMRTERLGRIKIPVPPIEVQREIVRLLDAYTAAHDALVAKLNEEVGLRRAQYDALIEEKFVSMFGNPMDEDSVWDVCPLRELTTKIGSGATPKGGKTAYCDEGVSLIRSMNVYDQGFRHEGLAHINDEQADVLSGVAVSPGDVLLNITGASIARCCVVPDVVLPARVNQHVCIIRVKGNLLNPVFLHAVLTMRFMKEYLLKTGDSTGSTRQALTKKQIEGLRIIVPPIEKQLEFVKFANMASQSAMVEVVGLLAEDISLHEAQLAEFRDQLLSFPERAA